MRPETQAHDLRDMLLLKSMYFRFFSLYNIGIPLFLENKSYPGIPIPRSCMSVTIPTITTGSDQDWTSLHPPILTPPPNSREQELSRYTDPTQLHECYHTNNHNRVWSETQASGVVTSGVKNRFLPHCTPIS